MLVLEQAVAKPVRTHAHGLQAAALTSQACVLWVCFLKLLTGSTLKTAQFLCEDPVLRNHVPVKDLLTPKF